MAELESAMEKRLIDQLCGDESQWTYRSDIRTEEQLWNNFKYILEQNNKAKLNDVPLNDSEFAKIKNDISHASFYDAGKWLVGAMRTASKQGESGFIWHTTGSGKTMTSYKATRNLLMDIPSIEKTVFLIDRKDLDVQTKMAFQSYADNDTIDVDDTDYVDSLIEKMADGKRQMIVTTRQKMQIMVNRRLKEGTKRYEKIKSLRVAFVVDECHRAVTPQTKRELERFFANSLWYGFTGTPIFEENSYEQKGDLPRTTEQMYGRCLHSYTIKEAIHDEAVLGFMVENLGAKDLSEDEAKKVYETEEHMRKVLNVILNQSYNKFGMNNGRGRTYEAILTTDSIERAQKYYDLLKKVKEGKDELKISDTVYKALPDFPRFAITYSLSENEEASTVNQDKMKEALKDYNKMFGSSYQIDTINAYNNNLNERLARKEKKYLDRSQQLDLVIVVDRLLTGFDAPCLSTLFIDRQPMAPQNIIQAFSRTNRLFDYAKQYGQIVTFQAPKEYKNTINSALKLYSRGGDGNPVAEDWDDVKTSFSISLKTIRNLAQTSEDIAGLSRKQKKAFVNLFRALDHDFAHLKAFSVYEPQILDEYGFSEDEYENYAAMYKNVMEELKKTDDNSEADKDPVWDDYDLVAYSKLRIDFEYIVELLRGVVESLDQSENDFSEVEFETKIGDIKEIIDEFVGDNPKLSALLIQVVYEIEKDKERFLGQDISIMINQMRYAAIDTEIRKYAEKWYLNFEDVRFEAFHFRDGELANENKLKDSADYATYKKEKEDVLPKFKFRKQMIDEFKNVLMPEIAPLID